MKSVVLYVTLSVILGYTLASPVPEPRLISLTAYNNLTITAYNNVIAQQVIAYTAMTSTFINLNLNYYVPTCYNTYNWFLLNYLNVGTYAALINTALTVPFGSTIIVGGACGNAYIISYLQIIVDTLNQANQYLTAVDSTKSTAMATSIQSVVTLQGKIVTALSCANTYQTLYFSCPDNLYNLISQFLYQSGTVLSLMTTGWCTAVSNDNNKCTGVSTTTTSTTTTTTTVK